MANYDSNDIDFTWDGDFTVGDNGDIGDTSRDLIIAVSNAVREVLKAENFDWEKDPTFAANISDFQGEPNSRKTGKLIEERISSAITNHGIVRDEDLTTRVTPVHVNQVLVMIRIIADSTSGNSISPSDPIKIDLIYDTIETSVFFLLDDHKARAAIP